MTRPTRTPPRPARQRHEQPVRHAQWADGWTDDRGKDAEDVEDADDGAPWWDEHSTGHEDQEHEWADVGSDTGERGSLGEVSAMDRDLDDTDLDDTGGGSGWLPVSVLVAPRHVDVGGGLSQTLTVTGYPREVSPAWLEPLTTYPARVDVSLHIEPVPAAIAATGLRRQLARLESGRAADAEHGRLPDPSVDAATVDAYELAGALARAETKLFRVALSLTVRAADAEELAVQVAAVRSLAASMLIDAQPVTYRALRGWISNLPLGLDLIGPTRAMDTDSLAAAFPFASPDLPGRDPATAAVPRGVLYGSSASGSGLVFWDRYAPTLPNHNGVILAQSGAGKSYLTKLELLRGLYRGVDAVVIDPEDEYTLLAAAVGGTCLRLGDPDIQINPMDLPQPEHRQAGGPLDSGVYLRRCLHMHTVLEVMLGGALTAEERAVADYAIHAAYKSAGITSDPTTWHHPAPLLSDLAAALGQSSDPDGIGVQLARRLTPFTEGSFSTLFSRPTSALPGAGQHLVVWSLRHLPDELKAIGTLLALDATWRALTTGPARPLSIVVDEAWQMLSHDAGALFLRRLAKSARKYFGGLVVVTQDVGDLLSTELGVAVISNSATQIVMRTAPQALDRVAAAFGLSDGERAWLATAPIGTGLLIADGSRVPFLAEASAEEDRVITTDPRADAARHLPPTGSPTGGLTGRRDRAGGSRAAHIEVADEQDPL